MSAAARRDEAAVRRYVERTALLFADYGFPRMAARVLLTLMSADDDLLTAADLSERLGASPAAISGAVRYLVMVGLAERDPVPGSRSHGYRLVDDAWYVASVAKGALLRDLAARADEGVAALGGRRTPAGRRTDEMAAFFRFVDDEMGSLMDRWHAQQAGTARRRRGRASGA